MAKIEKYFSYSEKIFFLTKKKHPLENAFRWVGVELEVFRNPDVYCFSKIKIETTVITYAMILV